MSIRLARRRIGATVVAALALVVAVHTQAGIPTPGTATPTVVLRVPTSIDPSAVTVVYSMGAGYGPLRTSRGVHDYVIETAAQGRTATSLKAWAYAPGFGFALVSLDLTRGPASRTVILPFRPLGTVAMMGRVLQTAETRPFVGRQVEALYSPVFTCEFFMGPKWMDCLTGPIVMASASIDDDGQFALPLPDLAHDPSLASFRDKGSFGFRVMEAPGRPAFYLRLGPPALTLGLSSNPDLAVTEKYGGVAVFSENRSPEMLAIARAQNVFASDLSSGLPRVSLKDWLLTLAGAAIWSINDCGEQTGDPAVDAGRDFPECVTAHTSLPDGRALLVSILVGTQQTGVTGAPAFWSGDLIDQHGEPRPFRSLADVAEFARTLPGHPSAN